MKRTATAVWVGGPNAGEGSVCTASGVFNKVIYTFGTSAVDIPCTNPLEMLAAAEASCMALTVAHELAAEGIASEKIEACAELTIQPQNHDHWSTPKVHLTVTGHVTDLDAKQFVKLVQRAKNNCPVSRCLKAEIILDAVTDAAAEPVAVH